MQNTQTKLAIQIRSILAGGLSLVALSGVTYLPGAIAQTAADQNSEEVEKISITGSRIKRTELTAATPVTSFSAEDIANTGRTNIEDILSVTPALVGSTGVTDNNSGAFVGANFLNLRNLGSARTLVLVDGRRHVGANELGSAAVDTNSIPIGLIERIEVTTGGASAVYGADGVSGVVNFIMRDDFDGTAINFQAGQSGEGDSDNALFSLLLGNNFDDNRGNLTFSYEYNFRGGIRAKDRDFLSNNIQWYVNNPAEQNGKLPGVPAQVLSGNVRDVFVAADGLIDPFGLFSSGFRGGDVLDRGNHVGAPGAGVPSGTIGGNGTEMWRIIRWGIVPEQKRHTVNLLSHYDFSDDHRGYADVKFSQIKSNAYSQSSFTILNRAFADNPFLPASVAAAAAAVNAGTPSGPPIMYSRFDIDSQGKLTERTTDTFRLVLGMEGTLGENHSYDISLNYGQSDVTRNEKIRYDDRYFAALDAVIDPATGKATCRSNLDPSAFANTPVGVVTTYNPANGAGSFTPGANSGCVALNPFIDDAAAHQAAYDWIYFFDKTKGKLSQFVLNAYISGDTSSVDWELQGGAVQYVLGAEYRKEKSEVDFPVSRESGPIFTFDRGVKDQSGDFDVSEVFAEVSIPIFYGNGLMMEELTLNGAYRFSDYSTIGNTNTWEVGLLWAPIEDVRFRATLSQAIRAPNINELFAPKQPRSFLPVDPCSVDQHQFGPASRKQNCAQALGALGLSNDLKLPSTAVNFTGSEGGNVDLKEEEADTYTLGVVLEPSFVDGLAITLDYYHIEMTNGIVLPNAQNVVNGCYDAPSLDNPFCPLLSRATNGDLNGLDVSYINVASFRTSGIDFTARYGLDMGESGVLEFAFSGGWLKKLDIQSTSEPVFDNERGEANTLLGRKAPKFILNFDLIWKVGDVELQYGFNHHDELLRIENEVIGDAVELRDPYKTDAMWDHSVRFSYQLNDNTNVYLGVRNLTDEKPAPNSTALPISPVGRFFYAGIRLNLDSLGDLL